MIFILARCASAEKKDKPPGEAITFESYTTAEKCVSCHKEIYDSHLKTAHYLTGQPAEEKFIKGSFEKGSTIDGLNYGTFLPGFSKFSGSNDFLRELK